MHLRESSFDLLNNPLFKVSQRKNWMIPTPFVLNDAVVIIQTLKPSPKLEITVPIKQNYRVSNSIEKDTIQPVNETN